MRHLTVVAIGLFVGVLVWVVGCDKKSADSGEEVTSSPITILSPNGGETWIVGKTNEITWTSSNVVSDVRIELNTDYPSGPWETIIGNKTNSGSYSWRVTQSATLKARVRITSLIDSGASDISNDNFTLADAWTVMIYADGNNYADCGDANTSCCIRNLQLMETVSNVYGVNVIAMLSSIRLAGGARYYEIGYYPLEEADTISSPILEEKGAVDMSYPAALKEFLNYCMRDFPAQHYLLVLDDHGEGWRGSCLDEVNGNGGLLTMPELRSAIAESDLHRVDAIAFHACQMAMVEVAYELRECADYVMASQFVMPMEAVLGGDVWLTYLRENPDATPREFCESIVQSVGDAAGVRGKTIHYVLIDPAAMSELANKIGAFGNCLVEENAGFWDEIGHAWTETNMEPYDNSQSVDIREFAKNILLEPHLSQSNLIQERAADVSDAVDAAVLYSVLYFNPSEYPIPRGGLNIHLPKYVFQFDSADYVNLDFAAVNWQTFVSRFLATSVSCPFECTDAGATMVGNVITTCRLSEENPQHWFKVTLMDGEYRFSLCDFPEGADYDLYTFLSCEDFPQNPSRCTSDLPGCEEFVCQIAGTMELRILINAYEGPMGYYQFSIERVVNSTDGAQGLTLK